MKMAMNEKEGESSADKAGFNSMQVNRSPLLQFFSTFAECLSASRCRLPPRRASQFAIRELKNRSRGLHCDGASVLYRRNGSLYSTRRSPSLGKERQRGSRRQMGKTPTRRELPWRSRRTVTRPCLCALSLRSCWRSFPCPFVAPS